MSAHTHGHSLFTEVLQNYIGLCLPSLAEPSPQTLAQRSGPKSRAGRLQPVHSAVGISMSDHQQQIVTDQGILYALIKIMHRTICSLRETIVSAVNAEAQRYVFNRC